MSRSIHALNFTGVTTVADSVTEKFANECGFPGLLSTSRAFIRCVPQVKDKKTLDFERLVKAFENDWTVYRTPGGTVTLKARTTCRENERCPTKICNHDRCDNLDFLLQPSASFSHNKWITPL